jgi:hypothetical protein
MPIISMAGMSTGTPVFQQCGIVCPPGADAQGIERKSFFACHRQAKKIGTIARSFPETKFPGKDAPGFLSLPFF